MDEDYYDDIFESRDDIQRTADLHLNSPIRKDYRELFQNYLLYVIKSNEVPSTVKEVTEKGPRTPTYIKEEVTWLMKKFKHMSSLFTNTVYLNNESMYGVILASSIADIENPLNWVKAHAPVTIDEVQKVYRDFLSGIGIKPHTDPWVMTQFHQQIYSQKVVWEDIKNGCASRKESKDHKWVLKPAVGTQIFKHILHGPDGAFFIFNDKDITWKLLPHMEGTEIQRIISNYKAVFFDYEQIMMLSDTILSRVFTYFYMSAIPHNNPSKVPKELLTKIYTIFDSCIRNHGNSGYKHIKNLESLCHSKVISLSDVLLSKDYYLNFCLSEIEKDELTYANLFYEVISDLSTEQIIEIHGMYRHWGHPTVTEMLGCKKVKDIAQSRPKPSAVVMHKILGHLKRQFIVSYISKEGRWPNCDLKLVRKESPLHTAYNNQSKTINLHNPTFNIQDWGNIIIKGELNFDYNDDFLDLLSDKSLSYNRSEAMNTYDTQLLGFKPASAKTSKRVLLEALSRTGIDIKNICECFQLRRINNEWKIVCVCSKERELKIDPRLFAMLPLEVRIYFCVTESNLSKKLFPYFPQQSMTLKEHDLSKKLSSFASKKTGKFIKHVPVFIGIDFKSWNIHWSKESTQIFFEFYDELFNTPGLYTATHWFFEQCVIMLSSRLNPPSSTIDNPNGPYAECETLWYNHKGGFEGLRQKGWTLPTIGLLLLVSSETGILSKIIGQGDNQVCQLFIPIETSSNNVAFDDLVKLNSEFIEISIQTFLDKLEKYADLIGLQIKRDETWVSINTLIYGKEIFVNGAPQQQCVKRMGRTFPDVNDLFHVESVKIATLQTSGLSTITKGIDMMIPYCLTFMETILTLIRDFEELLKKQKISDSIKEQIKTWIYSPDFIHFVIFSNGDITKCQIINPIEYLYRGHPDPLTAYTTFLSMMKDKYNVAKKLFYYLSRNLYKKGKSKLELLISNPISVNIQGPVPFESQFKEVLSATVKSACKNKDMKSLLEYQNKNRDKEIFNFLGTVRPIQPRVLHEIFRNSLVATRNALLARFNSTRTIQGLVKNSNTTMKDLYEVVSINNWEYIEHWWSLMRLLDRQLHIVDKNDNMCPTILAQMVRDVSWGDILPDGYKIEYVTVPHPVHQFQHNWNTDHTHNNCIGYEEYISFSTKHPLSMKHLLTSGPYPPYIGSHTVEKIAGKIFQTIEASKPLAAAQRLSQLIPWCVSNFSTLETFIHDMIRTRTDLPLDIISKLSGAVTGGNVMHRLNDHATKRGTGNNCRPNCSTHNYMSTDNMGRFSRGSDNYNMHFQGALQYGYVLFHLHTYYKNDHTEQDDALPEVLHLHYACKECEEQLLDCKLSSEADPPKQETLPDNKIVFAQSARIRHNVIPDTSLFQYRAPVLSSIAAASSIFARFIRCIGCNIMTTDEIDTGSMTELGVQEISKIPLKKIIHHLAEMLILYKGTLKPSVYSQWIMEISGQAWGKIPEMVLLPEVSPVFISACKIDGINECFKSHGSIAKLLFRLLLKKIHKLLSSGKVFPNPIFFVTKEISIYKVLKMWLMYISIKYKEPIIYRHYVRCMEKHRIRGINTGICKNILHLLLQYLTVEQVEHIIKYENIMLSKHPMEKYFGSGINEVYPPSECELHYPISIRTHLPDKYVLHWITESLPGNTKLKSLTRSTDEYTAPRHWRQDQQYRTIGDLSTGYLKYMEIIAREECFTKNPSIHVGEGEGSVAKMCFKIFGQPPYYNSLVDTEDLVKHRAINYVPGSFLSNPNSIYGGDLCALMGGDLTDKLYLKAFLKLLPCTNGLLTCDAETSGLFSPSTTASIFSANLLICYKAKIQFLIFKTFCHDSHIISQLLAALKIIFQNVKIIVPCYSSNESYEVFLYADNPCYKQDHTKILWKCHEEGKIFTLEAWPKYISAINDIKSKRLSETPFQYKYSVLRETLLNQAKLLGFHNNYESTMSKYICHTASSPPLSNNRSQMVLELSQIQKTLHEALSTLFVADGKAYVGDHLTIHEMASLSTHAGVHNSMDRLALAYYNVGLLKLCIPSSDQEIKDNIEDYFATPLEFHHIKTANFMYKLHPSYNIWTKEFLKLLWRLVGHIRNNSD